ncbi:MAG TPA: aldolase/citrate lyase family protein [Burkholderiales bacterium]|nr:aldolase/citrate lyase family protein [Burkholderiales bacterium]
MTDEITEGGAAGAPSKRQSWLIVPPSKRDEIEQAARSGADVLVLDLVELLPDREKSSVRNVFRDAIAVAKAAGAEVFAQIDPSSAETDLRACVWPGLAGVVISRAESAAQVGEIGTLLDRLEMERGIAGGTVHLVAALETAQGNHAAHDILHASHRMFGATLGRADLVMDLRPEPSGEIHLMAYLMQRLIIITGTVGVTPLGAWWRAPDRGLLATPENTYNAAHRGRAIGFKGAMCLRPEQVEPLNRAFGG